MCDAKNWEEAMRRSKKKSTIQSRFGMASWSISASLDWVRLHNQRDTWRPVPVCLPAYVTTQKSQEYLPHRTSGRLPNVIAAICSIYKLPCCPRMGTRCPVNIKAAVYEQRKNNRLTHEWLFSLIHIIFLCSDDALCDRIKLRFNVAACLEAPLFPPFTSLLL